MRSMRAGGAGGTTGSMAGGTSKWDPQSLETSAKQHKQQLARQALDYSSSEGEEADDERARLRRQKQPQQQQQHYSSGSDNTYAEANLLTGSNAARFDGYDSEIYANTAEAEPLSLASEIPYNMKRLPQHQQLDDRNQPRYATLIEGARLSHDKSPFLSSSSNSSNRTNNGRSTSTTISGGGRTAGGTSKRRGQIMLTEAALRRGGGEGSDYSKFGTQPHNSSAEQRRKVGDGGGGDVASSSFLLHQHQHHHHHQGRSLSDDSGSGSGSGLVTQSASGIDPVVMPGFPVSTLQGHPPPPYSPSRDKFGLSRKCRSFHCSWKVIALTLTALTLVLSSVIAYFGAVSFPSTSTTSTSSSALSVRDDATVVDAGVVQRLDCPPTPQISSSSPSEKVKQRDSFQLSSPPTNRDLIPGEYFSSLLDPLSFWRGSLRVDKSSSFYQMNVIFEGVGGGVAVYGKRNSRPSVTDYDWVHLVNSDGVSADLGGIKKRSLSSDKTILVEKRLQRGQWYIAILNDDTGRERRIRGVVYEKQQRSYSSKPSSSSASGSGCPNGCSGRGECVQSRCRCEPQFSGEDCSLSSCPLLCSGHGIYGAGRCHCDPKWKGVECDVPVDECEVLDCNGHGACKQGVCLCKPGWTGANCDKKHCPDPTCSGHGACVNSTCHCDLGWMGPRCERRNEALFRCLPDCSGRGRFDQELGRCDCQTGWSGRDCNITLCNTNCGPHGRCEQDRCVCERGWEGVRCGRRGCDPRCEAHGECDGNTGQCICHRGWNGKFCTLSGCGHRADCHGKGICEMDQETSLFRCHCEDGWSGENCQFAVERECHDEVDNDGNGLSDCADSNCCSSPSCAGSVHCIFLADPVEVLFRKAALPVSSSFLQRTQFLFEGERSVQSYVRKDVLDERRISIVRGQVVTASGEDQGIIGVRVSVANGLNYGFTLTRPGGWFDLAVNGGGAITLQFQRSPLNAASRTIYVPWNEILTLNPVVMTSTGGNADSAAAEIWHDSSQIRFAQPCLAHDSRSMRPELFPFYLPNLAVPAPKTAASSTAVFAETRTIHEKILIPGSNLHLTYDSASAARAKSRLGVRLTPASTSPALRKVLLSIRVAGTVFRKIFEAEPDLEYTFGWDKLNVYNQKVYGVVEARVSVGYEYAGCETIWTSRTAKMQGFRVDTSSVGGGWNLDIHHHYDSFQGILQKGDGGWKDYRLSPPSAVRAFGSGKKRAVDCKATCEGDNPKQIDLLTVISMTSGPDGSVFIGDYNLIRRVSPDGRVKTVYTFASSQGSFHYDMKVSAVDNHLYLSHAERRQIWKFSLEDIDDDEYSGNFEHNNDNVVAGTGERCLPGAADACGDGRPAAEARLDYPKGIALATDGTIYISDSRNIRSVNSEGIISTLIGNYDHANGPPKPLPCESIFEASKVRLQWPTRLSLHPLDNTLHIVDDSMVLKLTADLRVEVVAGQSQMCHNNNNGNSLTDAAFAANGNLFISEKRPKPLKGRIRVIDQHGRSRVYFPRNCTSADCDGFEGDIAAVSVLPDGTLFAADNAALAVFEVKVDVPKVESDDAGEVNIADEAENEIYTFNRYGQHIFTSNLATKRRLYQFEYTKNTAFGLLSSVTDSLGNKITLQRDYTNRVKSIENTLGQKFIVGLSRLGFLESFRVDEKNAIRFSYDSGLIKSKRGALRQAQGNLYAFEYDDLGQLSHVLLPSGESFHLQSSMTEPACSSAGRRRNSSSASLPVPDPAICVTVSRGGGGIWRRFSVHQSGDVVLLRAALKESTINIPHHGEEEMSSLESDSGNLAVSRRSFEFGWVAAAGEGGRKMTSSSSSLRWRSEGVSRALMFEGREQLVGVHYDPEDDGEERITDGRGRLWLRSRMQPDGVLPRAWSLTDGGGGGRECVRDYDRIHRPSETRCPSPNGGDGETWTEELSYEDRSGLIRQRLLCKRLTTKFTYDGESRPEAILFPSGKRIRLEYKDGGGGLRGIVLPSGAKHEFAVQHTGLGEIKGMHRPPGFNSDIIRIWNSGDGNLLQARSANAGSGIRLWRYDEDGDDDDSGSRIEKFISGDEMTLITYRSGGVRGVEHLEEEEEFSMKLTELHAREIEEGGRRKLERRIDFDAGTLGLASAAFVCHLDDVGACGRVDGRIGGQAIPGDLNLKRILSPVASARKAVGEFHVSTLGVNETSVSDAAAVFTRTGNTEILSVHGRPVYSVEHRVDECQPDKIVSSRRRLWGKGGSEVKTLNFKYDEDGHLEQHVEDSKLTGFLYDKHGRLKTTKNLKMSYNDAADRLTSVNGRNIIYDEEGRISRSHRGIRFFYNSRNLLKRAFSLEHDLDRIYHYDHLGRLTAFRDNDKRENVTQFFYADFRRPHLVSHIYKPQNGHLTSFVYDDRDRLIFMQSADSALYVVCDTIGSPILLVSAADGRVVHQILSEPFGSFDPMMTLIGFAGGIADQKAGLIHFQNELNGESRAYDPETASFIVPVSLDFDIRDLEKAFNEPRDILDKLLNRYPGYDPVNRRPGRRLHRFDVDELEGPRNVLRSLLGNLKSAFPALNHPLITQDGDEYYSPFTLKIKDTFGSMGIFSAAQSGIQRLMKGFYRLSMTQSMSSIAFDPKPAVSVHNSPSVIGKMALVKRSAGSAQIFTQLLDNKDPISNTMSQVLNRSELVDFRMVTRSNEDLFYLVKNPSWQWQQDKANLKRLQQQERHPHMNITSHSAQGSSANAAAVVQDLRIELPETVLSIRYGGDSKAEKNRLLKHAARLLARRLWKRERDRLVQNPAQIEWSRKWTPFEAEQIRKKGQADGYEVRPRRDISLYPELANDLDNYAFVSKNNNNNNVRGSNSNNKDWRKTNRNNG